MADNPLYGVLKSIAPSATLDLGAIADYIRDYHKQYGVDTEKRLEAFLAQAAHESAGFRTFREYASGAAYEGRTDLGNTQPGDGTRFRGRGIFQITGRSNYKDVSRHLFGDDRLLTNPELLESPEYAVRSALYFWKSRNLNQYADTGNFEMLTKRINGGLNGWADRLNYFEKVKLQLTNQDVQSLASRVRSIAANNPWKVMVGGTLVIGVVFYYIYRAAKDK